MNLNDVAENGIFCDGDWIEKKDQDPNGDVRLIQLADIGDGFFKDVSNRYITSEKAKELNCTYLEKGDILIARLPEPLGRACIFPLEGKYITAVDIAVVRVVRDDIEPKYLMNLINSVGFRAEIKKYESGTTRKRISRKNLGKIEFSIPDIGEQRKTIEKLEETMSSLDNAVETLNKTKEQLAVYRQAVLKKEYSGDWSFDKAENLCEFITKGTTPKKSEMFSGNGEVPFIKVYNLTFDNSLDFTIDPTYVSKETHEGFLVRSKVLPGDVLMNIVGPPMGKVSIVPDKYPEWNINQAIARFRCKEKLLNKFLAYYLGFAETVEKMMKQSKATAGQFNLTLEICRNIMIPVPDYVTQEKIVYEIETKMSVCEEIERTVDEALQQAKAMRQSILKEAFEGRL